MILEKIKFGLLLKSYMKLVSSLYKFIRIGKIQFKACIFALMRNFWLFAQTALVVQ